jgi:hypothetical protein
MSPVLQSVIVFSPAGIVRLQFALRRAIFMKELNIAKRWEEGSNRFPRLRQRVHAIGWEHAAGWSSVKFPLERRG